jgi:hypothetical protein
MKQKIKLNKIEKTFIKFVCETMVTDDIITVKTGNCDLEAYATQKDQYGKFEEIMTIVIYSKGVHIWTWKYDLNKCEIIHNKQEVEK